MDMREEGARALLQSAEGLPALATLDVSNCDLYAPVLHDLAAHLPALRVLTARSNWIHPHEAAAQDAAASASGAHTDATWLAARRTASSRAHEPLAQTARRARSTCLTGVCL
jgi:hypothetical protein